MHVITLHTHDYSPGNISLPVVRAYCERWGYTLHFYEGSLSPQFPPAWSKIIALQRIMRTAAHEEWLTWSDADILILRPDIPLEQFAIDGSNLVFSRDLNGVCSGFFLIRNCGATRAFLHALWNHYTSDWPWEQAAIKLALSGAVDVGQRVAYIPESTIHKPLSEFSSAAFAKALLGQRF